MEGSIGEGTKVFQHNTPNMGNRRGTTGKENRRHRLRLIQANGKDKAGSPRVAWGSAKRKGESLGHVYGKKQRKRGGFAPRGSTERVT